MTTTSVHRPQLIQNLPPGSERKLTLVATLTNDICHES
jgi:hypothetical protein